ncbi:MAG: tripartite tricarboxylate transporter substrate-binding protein, partial [Alcaligenaceae bacterium]
TEVLGGSIQMTIDTVSVYLPQIKANNVKALAISTLERNPILPDLPPIADTLPGFAAAPVNYITAPAGTPRPIIERLNREINIVLKLPSVHEQFAQNGATEKGSTPEAMDALIRSESAKWKKIIDQSRATAN